MRRAWTLSGVLIVHGAVLWYVLSHSLSAQPTVRAERIAVRLLIAPHTPTPDTVRPQPSPEAAALTPPDAAPREGALVPQALAITRGSAPPAPAAGGPAQALASVDGMAIRERCRDRYPATSLELLPEVAPVLLVRVDADGRPLDVRIAQSSHVSGADSAISNCVMAQGAFAGIPADSRGDRWLEVRWPVP